MCVKEVMVQNQVGLHARPATFFIQKANEFKASIWVEKEERRVNAKSLLGVLSLGIVGGTKIDIIADGSDEQEAVDSPGRSCGIGFCRISFTGTNGAYRSIPVGVSYTGGAFFGAGRKRKAAADGFTHRRKETAYPGAAPQGDEAAAAPGRLHYAR